jgi:hypothetical protein
MAALAGHLADHRAVLRSAVWSRAAAPAVRSSTGALCAGRRSAEKPRRRGELANATFRAATNPLCRTWERSNR